jgi:hypothetical protein
MMLDAPRASKMRGSWLLALAAGALAISAVCLRKATSNGSPGLSATEQVQDMGQLHQGQIVDARFELVNSGKETLKLLRVSTSCGCTVSDFSDERTLTPGGRTVVTLHWNTRNTRDSASTSASVIYEHEDGSAEALVLRLLGSVVPDFYIEPNRLVFDRKPGSKQVVRFRPGGQPNIGVNSAYCTQRAFEAKLANRSSVEVSFDPRKWHDDITSVQLVVATNSPNEQMSIIPITVRAN